MRRGVRTRTRNDLPRTRLGLRACVALALCATLGALPAGAQEASSTGVPQPTAEPASPTPEERLAELRTLAELDLDAEVIARGRDAVSDGGELARNGEAIALVARALSDAGAETAAVELLAAARPSTDSLPLVALARARLALERDELETALQHLARNTEKGYELLYAKQPESWLLAAQVFARAGDPRRGARFAERFVEIAPLHPEAPVAWHLLELAAGRSGDVARALECRGQKERMRNWHDIVKARRLQIRRAPKAPEPRFGLAIAWMEVERYDRAEAALKELLGIAPGWCRAWFHLGEALRLQGRGDAALSAFDRGVECDPSDPKARFQRAELRWRAGQRDLAVADFRALMDTAVTDDPLFSALHLRLAQAALERGDPDSAEAHYGKYRSLGGTEPLE